MLIARARLERGSLKNPQSARDDDSKKDLGEAEKELKRIVEASEQAGNKERVAAASRHLGKAHYLLGKYADAMQDYNRYFGHRLSSDNYEDIDVYRTQADCQLATAMFFSSKPDYETLYKQYLTLALDDCEEVIKLDPGDIKSIIFKGDCLYYLAAARRSPQGIR